MLVCYHIKMIAVQVRDNHKRNIIQDRFNGQRQLNHWIAEGGLPPEQPSGLAVPPGMDPAAEAPST